MSLLFFCWLLFFFFFVVDAWKELSTDNLITKVFSFNADSTYPVITFKISLSLVNNYNAFLWERCREKIDRSDRSFVSSCNLWKLCNKMIGLEFGIDILQAQLVTILLLTFQSIERNRLNLKPVLTKMFQKWYTCNNVDSKYCIKFIICLYNS